MSIQIRLSHRFRTGGGGCGHCGGAVVAGIVEGVNTGQCSRFMVRLVLTLVWRIKLLQCIQRPDADDEVDTVLRDTVLIWC